MATWAPISNTVPQYYDAGVAASGFYLKFYVAGTTTPTSMATDSTGGTTLAKCQINSEGYPINGSNAVFVPHVDRTYKIILYRNATDADNNTTANAVWEVDSLSPVSTSGDSIDEVGSIASLIAGSWSQNQLYVSSYYDPSLPSVAGPKGGHSIHKTGATNAVPTVGAAVSVSTIGTGTQAGYYWDADGDEWYISIRNQTVNVFMYGAKGDGSTDDTAAIQTAINSGANKILFPKPTVSYLITDQVGGYALTVTNAGQVLEGDGMDLSILDYNSSTASRPAILVAASNVQIKNLQIDGSTNATDAGSGTAANCNGIQVTNVDGCLVSEVKVKGGHIGIHFENDTGAYANNKDNRAYKCVIRNTASSGIEVSRGENIQLEGNNAKDAGTDCFEISDYTRYSQVIGNMATDCTRDGFDFFNGFIDSVAANNVAEGNTLQGFEVKGTFDGSNYVVRDSTFIGNVARGNGTSGFLFQSVRNINSVGNKAISNTTSGFFFNNCQGGTFSSDHASKNTQHGFFFNGSENRTQLVACYAIDNSWVDGTTQNGTYDGFFVTSGSTIHFVGCSAINGTTSGEQGGQGYGISLNSAGSAIVGGYFSSNVTGDVENQSNADMIAVRDNAGVYMNVFGSWSSNADAAVNGYVEFVDDTGTTRKLATIA